MDVDDEQHLEPHALRRFHREEVERPERVFRARAKALKQQGARPARKRSEAVVAEDLLDGRPGHRDPHAPGLLLDTPLAPGRVLRFIVTISSTIRASVGGRPPGPRCSSDRKRLNHLLIVCKLADR